MPTLAPFLSAAADPPAEYGMMPFWFWNDDLDLRELLRQLHAFHDGGMGGVVIHPRTGLSHRVGYLTPEYFRLVRLVVDECARLGMKVILYDEGGYPSGSACGQVVAANPDHAARALILVKRDITGPWRGYWRPNAGRTLQQRLVAVVLASAVGEGVDPTTLRLLEPDARGLVRVEVGPGDWRVLACCDVPSGGTIRGVFAEHEDGTATAPPAGDILNPAAVASFIHLTHEAYARHLEGHLGATVVALFTDEPHPLGRGARRSAQPYTAGLEAEVDHAQARAWLPALWVDYGQETAAFRQAYAEAVEARLRRVFYGAQAAWCAQHGLALTGHPADSDDMASLADFQWPGQDMVWRWVVPGNDSGLVGAHSTAPKAAASAARAARRGRAVTELFGAYGWGLTLDEAKWLLDWHLARGVNLFLPHACFYSVRGGRAYESEPDVGLYNPWWPHFQLLARYVRRMSWLLATSEQPTPVAILSSGRHLPWKAAKVLYEHQIDFFYVQEATDAYRAVVGGAVPAEPLETLADRLRAVVPPDVTVQPPCPDLRAEHVRKDGIDAYLLFNEGEGEIRGTLRVAVSGNAVWWDPLRDSQATAEATDGGWRLVLPRRESRVLLVGVDAPPAPTNSTTPEEITEALGLALGDWAEVPELERFSGTRTYTATVHLSSAPAHVTLDLGGVGDAATVEVNGLPAGFALWAPYVIETPPGVWRAGENLLEIRVTNSAANAYEGAMRPSGLLGPVRLRM